MREAHLPRLTLNPRLTPGQALAKLSYLLQSVLRLLARSRVSPEP